MSKPRDDSTWNQLSPDQRETLESWLFDQNLGYAKTLERVQQEFGLQATIASLGRFYRRRARERQLEELLDAHTAAKELNGLPVSVATLREAAVRKEKTDPRHRIWPGPPTTVRQPTGQFQPPGLNAYLFAYVRLCSPKFCTTMLASVPFLCLNGAGCGQVTLSSTMRTYIQSRSGLRQSERVLR